MKQTLLAVLALALPSLSHTADNGIYLGAGISGSDFDIKSALDIETPLDERDLGYKVIGGVRLLDSFGVELNLADHGRASLPTGVACIALVGVNCPDTTYLSARTAAAFAVGFADFPILDLFAKAGLSVAEMKLKTPGLPNFGSSDTQTRFAWGLGAQAHFGSLALRGEFEQFRLPGNLKLNSLSATFIYTIL